jgi:Janus kinase 2
MQPCIISASNDLIQFWNKQNVNENDFFTCVRGEWRLPNDKKMEVTLKILKKEKILKHPLDFMNLADEWCNLNSNEIVRLHGITFKDPISMVMEATNFGPLDEFLRSHTIEQVDFVCLIDAAHSLVRALHYLQDLKIIHGRIRCSTLQVSNYEGTNTLVVKLGDRGFPRRLTNRDIPWIPVEHFADLKEATKDSNADIWAVATTLWEIFSRGTKIRLVNPIDFFMNGKRLAPTKEMNGIPAFFMIYKIMQEGWHAEPEKRFSPQLVLGTLFDASKIS